ncbi:copper resistance protein CopC [Streptomyces mirabilis]|uniref:copper resistance protein CopC n=1 Tax=Streptomyces mirabilis TaxID=68239 RepID=UPI002E28DDF2|nr:copper resistance protein CopC [Streptomyces mirabilis]
MGDLLFGTTLLASFLGGVVALLAPCCVSVMLPAYLATGFRRRTGILAATLVFAAWVATVIVPIGLGATALVSLISGHHLLVFSIGGAAMALGGLALLAGWKPQLPMIAGRAPHGHGFGSVYGLGVFSGAASSCCAPVLAGVAVLSGAAASFPAALAVSLTYVAGMVAPLCLLALVWDRRDWGASRLLQGRQVTVGVGRLRRPLGSAVSGTPETLEPVTALAPSLRRPAGVLLALAALALAALLGTATPASAHATLLFTSPAADATVADSPKSLVLVFDQPVSLSGSTVRLQPTAGLGTAALSQGRRTVTVPVRGTLTEGVHTVDWTVTAQDGDIMTGSYRFAVGPRTVALTSGQTTTAKDRVPTTILRWLLFAALALLLGELTTSHLAARVPDAPVRRPRSWALPAALVGCAAALGLTALVIGDGSLRSVIDTRPGVLSLIEVAGFALAAVAVGVRHRSWAVVPLAAVVVAEALRAHPQAQQAVAGPMLTFIHLAAAALWLGALVQVLRTTADWRGERAAARGLLSAYARLAAWLFAAVVTTGVIAALLLVPLGDVFHTTYGQVLLAKIALVAGAAALAYLARRRLHSAPGRLPYRPARVEASALIVVLAVSATLTVLRAPADANRPLSFAPPTTGPVVPAGTRAGEIGISARASTGQLIVELTAPQVGNPDDQSYGLSATLADPRGTRRALKLRGCGTGCFYTQLTWREGTSHLTLTASAGEEWAGGRAGLAITWPARPDAALLRETVGAMKKAPRFTLHELVTSNTTLGLGDLKQLPITGKEFLAAEPYGSGTAPVITRLPDDNGHRRLALAYPAEHTQLDLTLDETGRILHETLTAPNHLVTRTFVYPETGEEGHEH